MVEVLVSSSAQQERKRFIEEKFDVLSDFGVKVTKEIRDKFLNMRTEGEMDRYARTLIFNRLGD